MEHLLTTNFENMSDSTDTAVYVRSGLLRKKHILVTGLMALASNFIGLTWVWVIVTLQEGIKSPLGILIPLVSIEWWLCAATIFLIYPVCLHMLFQFVSLCLLPLYRESIEISYCGIKYQKYISGITYYSKTINWNMIQDIRHCTDREYTDKYFCIYPYPNDNELNSCSREYIVMFTLRDKKLLKLEGVFIEEINKIFAACSTFGVLVQEF